jgi:hypothetical protein
MNKNLDVLHYLLPVSMERTYNFFAENLRDEVTENVGMGANGDEELVYVASILAHFAQTPRSSNNTGLDLVNVPIPADLSEIKHLDSKDPGLLEVNGSKILILAGFFRNQMKAVHEVEPYDKIGQSIYGLASRHAPTRRKRDLFQGLSITFPFWTKACSNVSRTLYDNQYLLKVE